MNSTRLNDLFNRYIHQTCTREEELELMQLLIDPEVAPDVERLVSDCYDQLPVTFALSDENADNMIRRIINSNNALVSTPPSPFRLRRMVVRYAVAAAIILFVSTVVWLFLVRTPKTDLATTGQKTIIKNDVAPGGNKAILTLADHSTIVLDEAANGTLAKQGKTTVIKSGEGQLVYDAKVFTTDHSPLTYNTLATPRGGQYQLVLPDGSKVWLNAASSIRYPTAFTGNERKVEITGEAYFEVAALKLGSGQKMPFKVVIAPPPSGKGRGEVEVLGTHFNINAYDDEPVIKTTLLEGSVKITKDAASAILKPGEQASLSSKPQTIPVQTADVEQVIAWKNGLFNFETYDIKTVMRQIARWYDLEVVYESIPKGTYSGELSRNSNLSNVFKILEVMGGVQFKIEGKKVIVIAK